MTGRSADSHPRPPNRGVGRPEHDVIIVGASMAGCRAALTLAREGVRVLLLDKARFPRWKPCAGGLTLKTRPYLPDSLFDLVECTIHGAHLTYGERASTYIRSRETLGWMIHRESFDEAHLHLAESQPTVDLSLGTTIREVRETPEEILVETNAGDLKGSVLIGADGAKSIISRSLPGHEDRISGFAFEGEARLPEGSAEGSAPGTARLAYGPPGPDFSEETLFDFQSFPHGYGWVFPKEDHLSLGGFIYRKRLAGIKDRYREFCADTGCLAFMETYRSRGHPIALGGQLRRLNSRRIVLVGEAGGLVDPLTGEGIYYALRSGHLAGGHVSRFLRQGEPLAAYGDRVREEIQKDLRYARCLADFVYRYPRLAFRLLFSNSLLCRWFIEIGSGGMNYRGLFREALKKSVILPFYSGISPHRVVQA